LTTSPPKQHPVQRFGAYLGIVGALALAGIFVVVMLNGRWPEFLYPVRSVFGAISGVVGDAAIVVEAWLFVGPGALIYFWGKRLGERKPRR
jgi:hypothetical protein